MRGCLHVDFPAHQIMSDPLIALGILLSYPLLVLGLLACACALCIAVIVIRVRDAYDEGLAKLIDAHTDALVERSKGEPPVS